MARDAQLEIVIRALDNASATLRKIEGEIDRTAKRSNRLGTYISSNYQAAGAAAAGMGAALGIAALKGFNFNSAVEQAQTKILAFTKDAGRTASILDWVKREAAGTQFNFTEMADAAANLVPASKSSGVALETLVRQAEVLAAINPAEGLTGAAFSLREALSGDFVSIVERFNLPRQRLNELKAQGVPAMEAIRRALAEMGIDFGVVAAQGQTTSARWDQIIDKATIMAGRLSKPFFDLWSRSLQSLSGVMDRFMPQIDALAKWLGENEPAMAAIAGVIGGLLAGAVVALGVALGPVVPILAGFAAAGAAVAAMASTLGVGFDDVGRAVGTVRDTASKLWEALSGLLGPSLSSLWSNITTNLLPALQRLWDVLSPILIPALKIIGAIIGGVVVGAIWLLINGLNVVVSWWTKLADTTVAVVGWLQGAFTAIGTRVTWLKDHWMEAIGFVIGFFATLPVKLPLLAWQAISGVVGMISRVNWSDVASGIGRAFAGMWDGVKNAASGAWNFIKNINWGAVLTGIGRGVGNAVIALIEGALNGAMAGIPGAPKVRIPRFAAGTSFAPGGLALVGERGPELVSLPRGSRVTPADETRDLLGRSSQGVVINQTNYNYTQYDREAADRELGWRLAVAGRA